MIGIDYGGSSYPGYEELLRGIKRGCRACLRLVDMWQFYSVLFGRIAQIIFQWKFFKEYDILKTG